MTWQGAMAMCKHDDVLWSVHNEEYSVFSADKIYPMKISQGTCLENQFNMFPKCKDNDFSLDETDCKAKNVSKPKDRRKCEDIEKGREAIKMETFFGKKFCGKAIIGK